MNAIRSRLGMALTLALLASAIASSASAQSADVLKIAHEVGAELKDWKYGKDAAKKQIDAQHFMLRVTEKLLPGLKDDAKKRILMSDLTAEQTTHDKDGLVSKGDKRTRGVAQALLDAGIAQEVAFKDAKPGDIVLYWMASKAKADEDDDSHAAAEKSGSDAGNERKNDAGDDKGKAGSKDKSASKDKAGEKEGGKTAEKDAGKPAAKSDGKDAGKKEKGGSDGAAGKNEALEWSCNSGVIEKVENNKKGEPKAWLYTSHRMMHGVGVGPKNGVRLVADDDRRVYVVRVAKKPAKP